MIMRKSILFLASAQIILAAVVAAAEVVDKVAIVVNDEIVTQGEIERMLAPVCERLGIAYRGEELADKIEETRRKIIEQLIEDRLILSEAKKQNTEVSEKEIDKRIKEVRDRLGSKKKFERALLEEHITVRDLRSRYKDQIMVRMFVDQKVGSKIIITPIEIDNYYKSHMDEFTIPEDVKFWNILIKPKEGLSPGKALSLAREIAARLKEGGEFSALAKIYSDGAAASEGGLTDYVRRGDLLPEIEKVIFNMSPGMISDVVQTSHGYHIFKIEDRRPRRVIPLAQAHRDVEEAVFKEKIRQKLKGWIEGLKKNAYIAYK